MLATNGAIQITTVQDGKVWLFGVAEPWRGARKTRAHAAVPVADARERVLLIRRTVSTSKSRNLQTRFARSGTWRPSKRSQNCLNSPYWTGRASEYFMTRPGNIIVRDALYWIPLMIAFHGLRREEAAQLRVHHVKSMSVASSNNTIWYFDLTAKDVLKEPTKGSPRCVPFHQKFQQLGFLEDKVFGRKPNEHLFPELSNENAHSAFGVSIGKRFGNYVNIIKFSEASYGDDLSLQAMRHTVRTLLDNTDAKEAFVDELVGHESEGRRSEGRRYRKEIYLQNLKATIDMLELPIDVDCLRDLALEMAPLRRKAMSRRSTSVNDDLGLTAFLDWR